jgi:hypothetical protein
LVRGQANQTWAPTTDAWPRRGRFNGFVAKQLSDKALKWLTDNAVIIAEQRSSAVEIFRCISDWLEGATA